MAGEKRSKDQDEISLAKTVLVDIEGTTTSISFVKETLFPYVRQNLKDYIETKWENEEFKQDYEKLKEQAKKDEEAKLEGFVAITGDKPEDEKDSLLKNVLWQMDNDRKTAALKQLQGHMWREAYKTGTVKGHIYEDVPKAIESWTNSGRKIYVYSSGSVEAQKLLFEYSVHGDLLKYFNGFFDTEVGAKQENDSYKNILSKIGEKPSNVVFLTDVVKEAAAAKEAGLSTVIVVREGNAPLTDEENVTYTTIKSFLDLTFQTSTKRQKIETTDDKIDKGTADVSEPMDTSEDVEMPNVSDKKIEKKDAKEVTESIETECAKDKPSENTSISLGQVEESAVDKKDLSNTEQEITESNVKSKENTNEDSGSSEKAKSAAKDDVATLATKDNDKDIAEKTEKKLDTTATEITTAADDSMDVSVPEPASKSETTIASSEKKIEDSTDVTKDIQAEGVDKTETIKSDEKADNIASQSQTCDKNITNKSEECLTAKKDEVKEESKIISDTPESENILAKSEQEVTKMETDVTENGETETTTEKTTVSETVTQKEETVTDVRKEAAVSEVSAEKSLEIITESEKSNEKAQGMKTETTDADKCETETTQQETIKEEESVKEENVVDTKDKNTVDSEKQKLNGTTQNGNTDVPVLDDKLHSNGLNEGPSKETTNEDAAAQNGEPESLSESSAESIKVKKVVDSAVADGAGEPDVVPPVVVAATS
ncbi:PREDICTED: enolase-phosphatase E1 [Cyphomyrmex costatus]|uniref:Enolase-phosphatase E1 n=1 Tax=Cyphomyrmex costatus TaxID=456900 RepID=A0A195CGC2_9HYME|nr:PREDICTED: enolase-phosphatase E1 [Cyphomyrmex costatus]KYM99785.1 Enolase-phosphatase E1 [Cyphomyrmex costatus]